MRKLPILNTPRLMLRPFKMDDAAAIAELANDKEIATNTENLPFPYEEYMALDWIRAHQSMYQENHMLTLAVVNRKKDQVMGAIGLEIEAGYNHAELGYWLGRPFWGQGFATEATRRIIHFGFTELKFHRIYAICLKQTPASSKVLQKIGMSYEGTMRQHIQKWGEYLDVDTYGILRSEYKP